MILILLLSVVGIHSQYTELNIQGMVEKPNTIYILQRSKLNKKLLKQKFNFKEALELSIKDPILEE